MRLNQVTYPVADVAAAKAFYQRLGLVLIVDAAHYCRFETPSGETFSIHYTENSAGVDYPLVYFEYDDLDAAAAELKAKGIAFEQEPVDQSWLWREARLRDPSGNQICLYQAGEKRRFPPWRVEDVSD